eukprot:7382274-Prymnesium_polylepis.1
MVGHAAHRVLPCVLEHSVLRLRMRPVAWPAKPVRRVNGRVSASSSTYRQQLEQVEALLAAEPSNSDRAGLAHLRRDLIELVSLTSELEQVKQVAGDVCGEVCGNVEESSTQSEEAQPVQWHEQACPCPCSSHARPTT